MAKGKKKRVTVPEHKRTYDPKKAPPRSQDGRFKRKPNRQGRLF